MALTGKSLFLYNYEVNSFNSSLDFSIGGSPLLATLNFGFYCLSDLMAEIKRAMESVDPAHTYTVTADRTFSSGTQNRVSITTSYSTLSLLFGTGPRVSTSVRSLIGFGSVDRTGSTSYQGISSSGVSLIPEYVGYSYLPPTMWKQVYGVTNVSTSGLKETIAWNIQNFSQVQFKFEPESKVISEWSPMFDWMIQQKPFEFTPNISTPSLFYKYTLESTQGDGKGLGHNWTEMLPDFPFNYQTGMLKFRLKI